MIRFHELHPRLKAIGFSTQTCEAQPSEYRVYPAILSCLENTQLHLELSQAGVTNQVFAISFPVDCEPRFSEGKLASLVFEVAHSAPDPNSQRASDSLLIRVAVSRLSPTGENVISYLVYHSEGLIAKIACDETRKLLTLALGISLLAKDTRYTRPIRPKKEPAESPHSPVAAAEKTAENPSSLSSYTIGKTLELSYKVRWPRFVLRWVGIEATVPTLAPVKNCFVNQHKLFSASVHGSQSADKSGKPTKSAKEVCRSKRSFFSHHEANVVAKKFNQRVYECPVCHCFHTTKSDF